MDCCTLLLIPPYANGGILRRVTKTSEEKNTRHLQSLRPSSIILELTIFFIDR